MGGEHRNRIASAALGLLLVACPGAQPPTESPPDLCEEAAARLGMRVCVLEVTDEAGWESLTLPAAATDQVRATKYSVPARPDARLPTLFMDAHAFVLHYDFLLHSFGDLFGGLTTTEYLSLILEPSQREMYAGNISEYLLEDESRLYGFTVWEEPGNPETAIGLADVEAAWAALVPAFDLVPLAYVPSTQRQRLDAASWADQAPFPVHGLEEVLDYEPYTVATGFGTLRRLAVEDLAEAVEDGELSLQDLVVLDDVPLALETVVSGIVTGGRQGELSHLNVLSAARGTPNCYLREPFEALEAWADQLVRLTCGELGLTVEPATPEEAEAFWEALRPEPLDVPAPDLEWTEIPNLLELPTGTEEERAQALARYGGKSSGLATLYQRIGPDLQLQGLAIPFHFYDQFVRNTSWVFEGEELTFQQTIEQWQADPAFRSDGALRAERLDQLRDAIRDSSVDPALIETLTERILATWGDDQQMVRFRSSSNAEDSLGFTGAGLYSSTSACLADELDGDEVGPSHCDPDQEDERSLNRALLKVWSSLWKLGAYEERDFWGIDHLGVAMGLLVNDRSKNEQANIVTFTGNPSLVGDNRFVVEAQLGDLSVVSPDAGEVTEKNLLTVEDGLVVLVERVRASSEVPAGEYVLDDTRLAALGAALASIQQSFPLDSKPPEESVILLDNEWKVLEEGRLIVKQVRPFLRSE
ncbi:MAG: PEP/pyruvate-binding domain-containing protein [Myxococcota bacterium]|nr:PEP/pyruvate-binding domain-containing protein [Myxococcota bacterium]